MNTIELTVESSTVSSKGGAILKLVNKQDKSIQTPFGLKTAGVQQTFYMKVDQPVPVATKGALDLDQFNIVERAFTFKEEDSTKENFGADVTVQLKWLHIK